MSAIAETSDRNEPIKVLFALHKGFDTLDFAGPLEVLQSARHDPKDKSTRAFRCATAAPDEDNDFFVTSDHGVKIKANMDHEDAEANLEEIDVLVVCGGNHKPIVDANAQPIGLIKAFVELQKKDPSKERTLLSICTGSFFLAKAGVLQGLSATTHPDTYTDFEILCQEVAQKDTGIGTDVQEERYVVNNARFELGENILDNPFIQAKRPDGQRRKSIARKGSDSWKQSRRRESIIKRANLPLGGMRVITAGGVTAGIDAALYLVAALVSAESATETARLMQFNWQKGVTVEGVDV